MLESIATGIGPDRLDIAYRTDGPPSGPPALLIMGLGNQLIHWPEEFVAGLVDRGFLVIRFDNRDSGRSSYFAGAPLPDFPALMAGDTASATYRLSDMAQDAVALLDHLGVESAHLIGLSMGGAIAQTLAIEHRQRVRSLTSMMSTTGKPDVGFVHPDTMKTVFGGPPVHTRADAIARALRASAVARPAMTPLDRAEVARVAGEAWDRGHDESAFVRQGAAVLASGDRTAQLQELMLPTLVVHGLQDTLCDPSGGRATAAAIRGAELLLIEDMGHALPRPLPGALYEAIERLARRAEGDRDRAT